MPRFAATMTQRGVYAPLILVEYKLGGQAIQAFALVDSGADVVLVPWEIVVGLGGDPSTWPNRKSGGGGGEFEVRVGKVDVFWGNKLLVSDVLVAPPGALENGLLGRKPLFERNVVRFNWHKMPPDFYIDSAVNKRPTPVTKARKPKRKR